METIGITDTRFNGHDMKLSFYEATPFEEADAILFMLLYTKNEAEDLTSDEKRQVAELARQFREETSQKGKPS